MKTKRKSPGRHRRRKGHDYERQLVNRLRPIFPSVGTSRNESKVRDDQGVDLVNTGPINVQAKAWASAPSYHTVLKAMPSEPGQHNTIWHKRPNQGDVVVIAAEDFIEIMQTLVTEGIWKSERVVLPVTMEDLK